MLIFIAIALYLRTIGFGITTFDDDFFVVRNFDFHQHLTNIAEAFTKPFLGVYYRPVITTSFILDAQFSQTSAWMYHCSNITFHAIASCLVFILLTKFRFDRWSSFLATLLFVLHPLATEAVAWIPGRNDSIETIFVLGSLIAFLSFREEGKLQYFFLHLVLFFLALCSKESALLLPIVTVGTLNLKFRTENSVRPTFVLLGWMVIILVWWLLRTSAIETNRTSETVFALAAFVSNLRVLPEVFGKMIFPFSLSAYARFNNFATVSGIIVLISGIVFLSKVNIKQNAFVWLGIGWVILFILPSLSVSIVDRAYRFDYLESRFYLPLVGLSIFAAEILGRYEFRFKKFFAILSIFIFFSLGFLTSNYISVFENPLTMWEHAAVTSPGAAETHHNLALAYIASGKPSDQVVNAYRRAINLNPAESKYHNELGVFYGRSRSIKLADEEFRSAIKADPVNPDAYFNLGILSYLRDDLAGAEQLWLKASALDSSYPDPQLKLVDLYIRERNFLSAAVYVRRLQQLGIAVRPEILDILRNKMSQ